MNDLNFVTYANILKSGISNITNENIVRLLIEFIIIEEDVVNINNEPYDISASTCYRWLDGREQVPKVIKKAAQSFKLKSVAINHFEENVLSLLNPTTEDDMYCALISLINNDDNISTEKKVMLISLYKNNDIAEFLWETFLYAVQKSSKKKKTKDKNNLTLSNLSNSFDEIIKQYKKLPSPKEIEIPDKIHNDEIPYTKELLRAFADAKEISEISEDDLSKYPKYKKSFERQRKYYYCAKSVRMFIRDILPSEEVDVFDLLKEEALNSIIEVHEDNYNNGLERLNSVLKQVSLVNMDKSIIAKCTNWIGINEKKGLCHMLVNEGYLKWGDDE